MSTDTACSSSLVAAHLAAGQLRLDAGGDHGGAALAGGVNIMLLSQTTSRICLLQARRGTTSCFGGNAQHTSLSAFGAFSLQDICPFAFGAWKPTSRCPGHAFCSGVEVVCQRQDATGILVLTAPPAVASAGAVASGALQELRRQRRRLRSRRRLHHRAAQVTPRNCFMQRAAARDAA